MSQSLNNSNDVLGATFDNVQGGKVIRNEEELRSADTSITVAAFITKGSLPANSYVNMLIINDPTSFKNADNQTEKRVGSSIIIAAVNPKPTSSAQTNITLLFRVLPQFTFSDDGDYRCHFFDTHTSQWNDSGCKVTFKNESDNTYICSCNHLTSFALIWSPAIPTPENGTVPTRSRYRFAGVSIDLDRVFSCHHHSRFRHSTDRSVDAFANLRFSSVGVHGKYDDFVHLLHCHDADRLRSVSRYDAHRMFSLGQSADVLRLFLSHFDVLSENERRIF